MLSRRASSKQNVQAHFSEPGPMCAHDGGVLPAQLLLLCARMLSQAAVFILQFDAQILQMFFRKPKQALGICGRKKKTQNTVNVPVLIRLIKCWGSNLKRIDLDFTLCLHEMLLPQFHIMERIWNSQAKEISLLAYFALIVGNFSRLFLSC